MHIYEIQKNGTVEFIYREEMEKQTPNRLMDMERGDKRVRCMDIKQIANGIGCMAQETQTGALYQFRGVGWDRRQKGASEGRGYMYTYG